MLQKDQDLSDILKVNNSDLGQRNKNILKAVYDGHRKAEIAKHLNLSDVAISKILKQEKLKEQLFDKLKDMGLFWSYARTLSYTDYPDELFIEHTFKYADYHDIVSLFKLYRKKQLFEVWNKNLKTDLRFIKTNLMIARIFFSMNIEANYFKGLKNDRAEKLRLLAS